MCKYKYVQFCANVCVYWKNCKIMVICQNKCMLGKYVIISGQLLYVWGANVLQSIFNVIPI